MENRIACTPNERTMRLTVWQSPYTTFVRSIERHSEQAIKEKVSAPSFPTPSSDRLGQEDLTTFCA